MKTVICVRHGESEYNAAQSQRGGEWADPLIFDPNLTPEGVRQCRELRYALHFLFIVLVLSILSTRRGKIEKVVKHL